MKILELLKQRGIKVLYYKIKHTFFVQNQEIRTIGAQNGSCEYLQRYTHLCGSSLDMMEPGERIIWVCWFQGFDKAPLLVQKCVESIRKYAGDYKLIELTETNFNQYITLPDYIIKKYHDGIISRIHFSDLLRLSLLNKYGGLWIDSTILLTGELPKFSLNVPLFVYRGGADSSCLVSVNFIACYKCHPIIADTLRMSYAYWKDESRTIDYTITSILWTIAIKANEQNLALWEDVPNVPCAIKDLLIVNLNKPFSEKQWQHITSLSSVHKLTYKFDKYGVDVNKKGTFYDVLINGNELS